MPNASSERKLFISCIARQFKIGRFLSFALLTLLLPRIAGAQTAPPSQKFTIDFYGNSGFAAGVDANISQYSLHFQGTFEIAASALGSANANGLILYHDPSFMSFDVPVTTPHATYDFSLSNPDIKFPGDPYPFNFVTKTDPVQGLRLDSTGQPQRFDTPSTTAGNGAELRDIPVKAEISELTLGDDDSFNFVELSDGSLVSGNAIDGRTVVAFCPEAGASMPTRGTTQPIREFILSSPLRAFRLRRLHLRRLRRHYRTLKAMATTTARLRPAVRTWGTRSTSRRGMMFYAVSDCVTSGQNPLRFVRYYNSRATSGTFAASLGSSWRTSYDRYLRILSTSSIAAERPDGKVLIFTLVGTAWTPDTDVDLKLLQAGSGWTLDGPRRQRRNLRADKCRRRPAHFHQGAKWLHADALLRREQ